MSEHTGKLSRANKSEGTEMPSDFKAEDIKRDKELTLLLEGVLTQHSSTHNLSVKE